MRIARIGHFLARRNLAADTVLGTEQPHELQARIARQSIDRRHENAIDARWIGDQAHALAFDEVGIFAPGLEQPIDAQRHFRLSRGKSRSKECEQSE